MIFPCFRPKLARPPEKLVLFIIQEQGKYTLKSLSALRYTLPTPTNPPFPPPPKKKKKKKGLILLVVRSYLTSRFSKFSRGGPRTSPIREGVNPPLILFPCLCIRLALRKSFLISNLSLLLQIFLRTLLLGLKSVGHFRKYGALVYFPYAANIYQHLDKVVRQRDC